MEVSIAVSRPSSSSPVQLLSPPPVSPGLLAPAAPGSKQGSKRGSAQATRDLGSKRVPSFFWLPFGGGWVRLVVQVSVVSDTATVYGGGAARRAPSPLLRAQTDHLMEARRQLSISSRRPSRFTRIRSAV